MKKYVITLLVLGAIFAGAIYNQTQASGVTPEDISSIESELFSQTYSNESINNRLDKIERMIYGKNFNHSDINERINNLTPFIPANNVNDKVKIPVIEENTSSSKRLPLLFKTDSETNEAKPDYLQDSLPPRQSVIFTEEPKNTTNYPTIDQAEMQLLGKVFASDDVYTRLNRLESKTHTSNTANNLYDRMYNIEKQIHYLSIKDKYNTARNVKRSMPDINIISEPVNNHYYNKNFSNGVQDQYINNNNYSNNVPSGNMNPSYMHQASYQNNYTMQPNMYAGYVPYASQNLTQSATNVLIQNTVAKKPGLWGKINNIGLKAKNAVLGTNAVESYNYYPTVY